MSVVLRSSAGASRSASCAAPLLVLLFLLLAAAPAPLLHAQSHEHRPGMSHPSPQVDAPRRSASAAVGEPVEPGQATFAAIAEVVRLLDADPHTDWAHVDLEALRRHLLDMDDVTMRALVRSAPVAGGAQFTVRGRGRTIAAIQRMARGHAVVMGGTGAYRFEVEPLADGARVTVRAARADDAAASARIRGLGFVGLLTVGAHHGPHHLAIARGAGAAAHAH